MSNVINLDEYRNKTTEIEFTPIDFSGIDPVKMKKLFDDIMNTETSIESDIRERGVELTRHIITSLYDMGADPQDPKLADDMIFISMLFTSALEEYFTKNYSESDGIENSVYRFLDDIREDIGQ